MVETLYHALPRSYDFVRSTVTLIRHETNRLYAGSFLTGTKAAPDMDWRWDILHNQFSQALIILSGFHLAINWDWALAAIQKVLFPWIEKVQERFRRFREGTL